MCFSFSDFLKDAQKVDIGEKETRSVSRYWGLRQSRGRVAEFVDLRSRRGGRWRRV